MTKIAPDWNNIDTVLLDMDGTLLDKYFDDHFWEEFVPAQYALKNGISKAQAVEEIMPLYRSQEETLDWTNLDFWTDQLGLDIPDLKKQVQHLIAVHPNVVEFLVKVKAAGKGIYLVTNAHGKTLDIKMEKTALANRFDGIVTSHEIGVPKEDPSFWQGLEKIVPFDPGRTLLGEDTEAVLRSAHRYGICYLVFIASSSSAKPSMDSEEFYSIQNFGEIMP